VQLPKCCPQPIEKVQNAPNRIADQKRKARARKPGKSVRHFDARAPYLEISETGRRWGHLKYRYAGKEKRLSLGVYPETSLKEARSRCDEARKLMRDGIAPPQQRKADRLARAERSEDTFEKVGREWYAKQSKV
jgi:hypothetical protein